MALFEIGKDRIHPLTPTAFAAAGLRERSDLQRLLRAQISVIDKDVLVIAEEFADWEDSRRRIDLLGVDKGGALVVIELKRTEDGGHMELQAIRYAAMVSRMTFDRAVDVYERYLRSQDDSVDARERLLTFLNWDSPNEELFAQDVRIVLASAEFSRELTSSVLWLNERGRDIRCVRLSPYSDGVRTFVDVQQVLPLPEAADYFVSLREKKEEERHSRRREVVWSGLWFVNVGMDRSEIDAAKKEGKRYHRQWDFCREYGYLSAGGGLQYSDPLKKLEVGAQVVAYQKGRGYVGYGVVRQVAAPIDAMVMPDGRTLEQTLDIVGKNALLPEEKREFAVGIDWRKAVALESGVKFPGIFANQNVVCRLRDEATTSFLRKEFGIPSAS